MLWQTQDPSHSFIHLLGTKETYIKVVYERMKRTYVKSSNS